MRRKNYKNSLVTRKVRSVRISLVLSFYLITMLFSYILGNSGNFVKAGSKMPAVYVESRVVKQGDTLWSIAKSYNSSYYKNTKDYVEAIKECNNLYNDDIYTGTSLIIPYTK